MEMSLDLTGLRCPLPVIRLEKAMRNAPQAAVIIVRADDPLAKIDLPHAAREAGFTCIPLDDPEPGVFRFRVSTGKR